MRKFAFVLGLMAMTAIAVFAGGGQEGPSGAASEFIVGNGAEPESLDPHLISGVPEHRIMMGLFEGLVVPDPETATAIPGVAESWEVSDDGTVYTFYLREDAVWSDGTPVTAQQFVDSWLRILDPELAASYAWFPAIFLEGGEAYNAGEAGPESVAVRALDERTFQFETVGPLPYTLDALTHYSFNVVPLHAIEEYGAEWTLPENFVGNGPYTLAEWSPQERIVLEPNPTFWDADRVEVDRVVFLPVEDDSTMYNMFVNGEMDWATNVPLGRIEDAELREDYHVTAQLATYYYSFNTTREPLNDPRVRQALSLAIDRELLVDTVTRAGQVPAFSMVPEMVGYPGIEGLGEDVELAQQLLAEAGFPGGAGFPEFTILYNTLDAHRSIAEFIQQQWLTNLGISVVLENQEWGTYLDSREQSNFDIARAGWVGDYQDPSTFLDMFITDSALNGGRFSNERYDGLISEAARMQAGPDRYATLAEAEQILIEQEMAVMPIYYYVDLDMIDLSRWGGWYANIMGWHPVGDIATAN